MSGAPEVAPARTPADWADARRLLADYASAVEIDAGPEEYAAELAALPQRYGGNGAVLLLARHGGLAAGVVVLRPSGERSGEVKRLYVAPAARGSGAGRALLVELIARARSHGYRQLLLDTLPSLTAATALYRTLGFRQTGPYHSRPPAGLLYFALDLKEATMLHGSCLCGRIRYEVKGPLEYASHCHCSQCRKGHGAAFATYGVVRAADFRLVAGEDSVASYQASPVATRTFCRHCGSNLEWRGTASAGRTAFALGTLDDDPGIRPSRHIHCASRAPWVTICDDLPRFAADAAVEPG